DYEFPIVTFIDIPGAFADMKLEELRKLLAGDKRRIHVTMEDIAASCI
ncbi:hypothetical protein Tco_1187081, partial [Tanacetum coccineum]